MAAYKLSEALSETGHSVDYVAVAPRDHRREVHWGKLVYASEGPGLVPTFSAAVRSVRGGQLDEYDVVHVHHANETMAFYVLYGLRRRVTANPRLAITVHIPKAHAVPRSIAEAGLVFSCRAADVVFAVSEFSKTDISRCYGVPTEKVRVTYNGVDAAFFSGQRDAGQGDRGAATLLFCGRLNGPREQKGIDVLLNSLPLVVRQHDVVLLIIGTGPRLDQYRALAEELDLSPSVRFLGFVEHDEMPEQYARADVFVLPSRREGFPLVLPEALASGLPVVATGVGGVPEIIADGETGLLVAPEDPHALAEAINSLLSDPERMKSMGMKGRARAKSHFTWAKVAERVTEGYHGLP